MVFFSVETKVEGHWGYLGSGGSKPRKMGMKEWCLSKLSKGKVLGLSWAGGGVWGEFGDGGGIEPKRIASNFLLCLVLNWGSAEQHEPHIFLILSKESHRKTSAFLNLIHYRLLYLMKLQQFNKWYNCHKYCFNIIMCSSLEHAIAFHNIIMTYAVIKFLIEGMQWMPLTC